MVNRLSTICSRHRVVLTAMGFSLLLLALHQQPAFAQALESRITQTIEAMTRLVNVLIVGFIVWSGFLIAKGDGNGFGRLIYGVIGLFVANTSYLIIGYFQ